MTCVTCCEGHARLWVLWAEGLSGSGHVAAAMIPFPSLPPVLEQMRSPPALLRCVLCGRSLAECWRQLGAG